MLDHGHCRFNLKAVRKRDDRRSSWDRSQSITFTYKSGDTLHARSSSSPSSATSQSSHEHDPLQIDKLIPDLNHLSHSSMLQESSRSRHFHRPRPDKRDKQANNLGDRIFKRQHHLVSFMESPTTMSEGEVTLNQLYCIIALAVSCVVAVVWYISNDLRVQHERGRLQHWIFLTVGKRFRGVQRNQDRFRLRELNDKEFLALCNEIWQEWNRRDDAGRL